MIRQDIISFSIESFFNYFEALWLGNLMKYILINRKNLLMDWSKTLLKVKKGFMTFKGDSEFYFYG